MMFKGVAAVDLAPGRIDWSAVGGDAALQSACGRGGRSLWLRGAARLSQSAGDRKPSLPLQSARLELGDPQKARRDST